MSAATCTGVVHYLGKNRPCRGRPSPGQSRCRKHLEPTLVKVNADDLYFLLYHALCGIEGLRRPSGERDLERVHALIDAYSSHFPPESLPALSPEHRALTPEDTADKEGIHDPLTFFLDHSRRWE